MPKSLHYPAMNLYTSVVAFINFIVSWNPRFNRKNDLDTRIIDRVALNISNCFDNVMNNHVTLNQENNFDTLMTIGVILDHQM